MLSFFEYFLSYHTSLQLWVYTGSSRLHTSGSSRPSYLRFIQTVIPPVHLEFSYLRFIQISFIPLVHLDFFHTSGSSRTSYPWFIQIFFIALVHLEHHTSGSSRFNYNPLSQIGPNLPLVVYSLLYHNSNLTLITLPNLTVFDLNIGLDEPDI